MRHIARLTSPSEQVNVNGEACIGKDNVHTMAKANDRPTTRVSDLVKRDDGISLEDAQLEDDVVILDCELSPREGDKGPYTLAIMTLEDGSKVHTSGNAVVQSMKQLLDIGGFPIVAKFRKERSQRNPRFQYLVVE